MINAFYYEPEMARWQKRELADLPGYLPADARLWLDLTDASAQEQHHLLQRFGVVDTLTEDFSRERHPPKFEAADEFSLLILRAFADTDFTSYSKSAQVNLLYSKQILICRIFSHNPALTGQLALSSDKLNNLHVPQSVKHYIVSVWASYFDKLMAFEEEVSELEDAMLQRGNDAQMGQIMRYRSVLRKISRNLTYQKDIFADALFEEPSALNQQFSTTELRDFYEKFERLHSNTELYYQQLSDLVDGYMSTSSHQINERMKVLTIVSTIFIPLTFMAGIYGMNFEHMPELAMQNAYFVLLAVMAVGGIGGLLWFKFKGWW